MTETASLENKIDRLLELRQQSARLILELQCEVRRVQGEIDDISHQALAFPDPDAQR